MGKKIQIDYSMFVDVYKLVIALEKYNFDLNTESLLKRIESQINAKIDAMERHETYTKSKMAETEDEKEKARQQYLDLIGMHKSFRYGKNFKN